MLSKAVPLGTAAARDQIPVTSGIAPSRPQWANFINRWFGLTGIKTPALPFPNAGNFSVEAAHDPYAWSLGKKLRSYCLRIGTRN